MTRLILVLVLLGVFGAVSGCLAARSSAPFNVAAKNVGIQQLAAVRVEFEGLFDSKGYLAPGGGGDQYSLFEGRWPKTAKITWRFEDDRPYMPDREVVVTVPSRPEIGPEESLTLWFDLDGESVTVRAETTDHSWINDHIRQVEAQKRDQ
jgi:hypothetical protein